MQLKHICIPHQILVHRSGAGAALGNAPDHQALASAAVTGGKNAFRGGHVVLSDQIAPVVPRKTKGLCHIALAAHKARGNQQQLTGDNLLAARYGLHGHFPAFGFRLQADDLQRLHSTGFIGLDFLDGGLIQPGIAAEFCDGLLLAVVCFQNPWPLGPGIGGQPGNRGLVHHFQLGDGSTALADGGANAVVSRISAADDDHIFPLGGDGKILRFPDDLFGGRGEEIHGIVDA